MHKRTFALAGLMILSSAQSLAADEAHASEDVQAKVVVCAGCHGKDGVATVPTYPNLAGQNKLYLESQLRAFRAKERENPIMSPMALTLKDEEIALLAEYYSNQ